MRPSKPVPFPTQAPADFPFLYLLNAVNSALLVFDERLQRNDQFLLLVLKLMLYNFHRRGLLRSPLKTKAYRLYESWDGGLVRNLNAYWPPANRQRHS